MPLKLSNDVHIDFLCASGALAFDGLGWFWDYPFRWLKLLDPHRFAIVVKTLTLNPRKGNLNWATPWTSYRQLPGGAVNAIGLTNPGLKWWINSCYPIMKQRGFTTILSLYPETTDEAKTMADLIKSLDLHAVELNASCPNTGHPLKDIESVINYAEILAESGFPLIVKISYNQPYVEIAKHLEGVACAVHAINTVAWSTVYPDKRSPLERLGNGGVSGKIIRPYVRTAVRNLKSATNLPIIAGGGIYELSDLIELSELGASAFSIGTLFTVNPAAPNRLIKQWESYLKLKSD